jgi:hypothetical protein
LNPSTAKQQANQKEEEKFFVVIDYKVGHQAAPKGQKAQPSRDWYNLQEGLRYQNEVERNKGIAQAYRFINPPK